MLEELVNREDKLIEKIIKNTGSKHPYKVTVSCQVKESGIERERKRGWG